jgi:hypothetical protein
MHLCSSSRHLASSYLHMRTGMPVNVCGALVLVWIFKRRSGSSVGTPTVAPAVDDSSIHLRSTQLTGLNQRGLGDQSTDNQGAQAQHEQTAGGCHCAWNCRKEARCAEYNGLTEG